ncbi:MAG: hypothetical protein ACI8X3_002151 [Saprospiraceae bacterium]|jgi:hypothetical protein
MFAEFRITALVAILSIPCVSIGQCPPNIQVIESELILLYSIGSVPTNLDYIDTDIPDAVFTNVDVALLSPTWQTIEEDFTDINPNPSGEITIYYTTGSPNICPYMNGIYNDPLPVDLSSFTGQLKKDNILLYWTTESEKNNAGFEIEQSFDGEQFSIIGMVEGRGNSETLWQYTFLDPGVRIRALGTTAYYRLVQVDFEGTKTYSAVLAISLELDYKKFEITKITGWDSPERKIRVHYYNPFEIRKIIFLLTDINGRVIEKRSIYPEPGLNTFEIDLSNQESPFYFLSLNNGKGIIGEKVALASDY